MELTLTIPALLSPALSLLLVAYTNRSHTLAAPMRDLYARYRAGPNPRIKGQLLNLRYRIGIIRNMQVCGVASFFGRLLSMFMLFAGLPDSFSASIAAEPARSASAARAPAQIAEPRG